MHGDGEPTDRTVYKLVHPARKRQRERIGAAAGVNERTACSLATR